MPVNSKHLCRIFPHHLYFHKRNVMTLSSIKSKKINEKIFFSIFCYTDANIFCYNGNRDFFALVTLILNFNWWNLIKNNCVIDVRRILHVLT